MLERIQSVSQQNSPESLSQNFGLRAWTSDSKSGNAQLSPGHQRERFQSLFAAENKTETAGQVAQAPTESGTTGSQLDIIA